MRESKVTVWFDGGCPLCRREISLMQKLDKQKAISFVDITSPDSQCPVDPYLLLARLHAEEDGRMLTGAAAFAAMWRSIPVLRPLGLAAKNVKVLAFMERAYVFFLRHRPKLQASLIWIESRASKRVRRPN